MRSAVCSFHGLSVIENAGPLKYDSPAGATRVNVIGVFAPFGTILISYAPSLVS